MKKIHQNIVNMVDNDGWKIKRKSDYYAFMEKNGEIIKVSLETGKIMPPKNIKEKA